MKRLLPISTAFFLIFVACGSEPTADNEPKNGHTHSSESPADYTHAEDDKAELINSGHADDTYTFDSDRYQYKQGHLILTWKELAKVTFEEDYDETVEEYILRPIFSDTLKALEGQRVMVEGYVIPFEETGDETFIVLSGLPYLQCFFCGGAGPETVIDILPKGKLKKRLKTDEKMTFKGKFRLNSQDLDYLNYILDDAELVN